MPTTKQHFLACDIAIIGGGIAGLWLLNRLVHRGYNAILFEQTALGSDQTVASQGMIHGGIKYTLNGALTGASEAIADMPAHWQACMEGKGDVNLQGATTLSDHFYMWSSNSALSKMTTFLASKATRGRINKVSKSERPAIFQHDNFKGSLYKLVDKVLDVPSVVETLANNCKDRIFKIDWNRAQWHHETNKKVALDFLYDGQDHRLIANQFVLTAGKGNEAILQELGITSPRMQRRPLQQVMVKHAYPHTFFGHCLGAETTPRLTISSHPCGVKHQVWYLGGTLAEKSANLSPDIVIANAKKELEELMPWVDLSGAQWATLPVDRAEPRQLNFARPDKAFASIAKECPNVIVAWPTKLTLCPNLADEVIELLTQQQVVTSETPVPALPFLSPPPIAATPWQIAFGD
ncbi:MAG: FAD-dependent oxidoreductase [Porticoccus sp.]|nr:FAD-dependent oxidoreductase [Porticoccus sp.]